MVTTFQRTVEGAPALIKKLDNLAKPSEARKVLAPGVSEAARTIRTNARALAPKDSGALRMSIQIKTKRFKGGVYAIVGPRFEYLRGVSRARKIGEESWVRHEIARPFKYAHLVEFGTHNIAPRPFMRPSFNLARTQRIIERRAVTELSKLAKKKAAAGGAR